MTFAYVTVYIFFLLYFFVHCSSPFSSMLYICFILTCTYTCVFVAVSLSIFFWNTMGNSLEAYRSAIGMFYNCSRISSKCVLVRADSYRHILLTNLRCSYLFVSLLVHQSLNPNVNVVFLLFVLHFILMNGNVELNPGPETYISSSPPNLDNSSNNNSISLCNINIRSIRNKTNFV